MQKKKRKKKREIHQLHLKTGFSTSPNIFENGDANVWFIEEPDIK